MRLSRAIAAALLAACGSGGAQTDAGVGPDAFIPADGAIGPDGAPLAWVDFSASGCTLDETTPAIDGGVATITCTGAAPLAVTFTPLASGAVDTWAWTFGDGATSSAATPVHTYALPGSYDVTLAAAGPGGSASRTRAGYLVATAAPLSAPCDQDAQCASGTCACGDAPCDDAVSFCAAACDGDCAAAGGVCGAFAGVYAPAQCVLACTGDADCGGRTCMPIAAQGGGWTSACVPAGVVAPIGAACAGQSLGCATLDCLAIGARGVCTVACADAACPDGSACATFGNGTTACLPSCDATDACGTDPWIDCEAPGASGAWGFTLDAAGSVCAPKSCGGPSDCPGGACTAGHCTAAS